MKLKWVKKAMNDGEQKCFWEKISFQILGCSLNELLYANISVKDLVKYFENDKPNVIYSFLKVWSKMNYKSDLCTQEEILEQVICNNLHLKSAGNKIKSYKNIGESGITRIREIYDSANRRFYTYNELVYNYDQKFNFLEYHALVQSIPQQWKAILKNGNVTSKKAKCMVNLYDLMERADYAKQIYERTVNGEFRNQNKPYDHGYVAWKMELKLNIDYNEWQSIQMHGHKISMATRLQLFQFKVLSKKLITNVHWNRWDRTVSDLCTFCKSAKETVIHLLWECKEAQILWKAITKWFKEILEIHVEIDLQVIICNKYRGRGEKNLIDTIILIAKNYLYICRCKQEQPKLIQLMCKVHETFLIEKNIATTNQRLSKFERKWNVYLKHM